MVGEFMAHDSRLRFGSLNHAPGDAINPLRSVEADATPLILLPLSGAQLTSQDLLLALSRSKMTPDRTTRPKLRYPTVRRLFSTSSRDPNAPQDGFGDGFLHRAIGPHSVHELVDGGKRRGGPLAHSDRHLHDVETSGQHACAG